MESRLSHSSSESRGSRELQPALVQIPALQRVRVKRSLPRQRAGPACPDLSTTPAYPADCVEPSLRPVSEPWFFYFTELPLPPPSLVTSTDIRSNLTHFALRLSQRTRLYIVGVDLRVRQFTIAVHFSVPPLSWIQATGTKGHTTAHYGRTKVGQTLIYCRPYFIGAEPVGTVRFTLFARLLS